MGFGDGVGYNEHIAPGRKRRSFRTTEARERYDPGVGDGVEYNEHIAPSRKRRSFRTMDVKEYGRSGSPGRYQPPEDRIENAG
jgi:hypothetical protein